MRKVKTSTKKKKKPIKIKTEPVPSFHLINQIMDNGVAVPLFKKPIFCTQDVGLKLGLSKCNIENDLIKVQLKRLPPNQQASMLLESNEEDLLRFTKGS